MIKTAYELTNLCPYTQAMVFCSNRYRTEQALKFFTSKKNEHQSNIVIQRLTADLTQGQREEALINLRDGSAKITIASDLAARGIDASGVDLVIHLDGASDWKTHQHRVGRGGRLGSFAVSIAVFVDELHWDVLLKQQLKEKKIDMTELAYDVYQRKVLPLPGEIIDHILHSGREIFNVGFGEVSTGKDQTILTEDLMDDGVKFSRPTLTSEQLIEKFNEMYFPEETVKDSASQSLDHSAFDKLVRVSG